MDTISIVLAVSLVLQFAAALAALSMIPLTGRRKAWLFISAAICLMALRRLLAFSHVLGEDRFAPGYLSSELVSLATSALMLVGILRIGPIFTNIKRSSDALRESEMRYRAIVEDQTELICRFLPDRTLTFVNDACCRYFKAKHDGLIGTAFGSFLPDVEIEKCTALMRSLDRENPVGALEHQFVTPDGKTRWQQWTYRAVFDDEGQFIEFQAVGRDVTERVLGEKDLRLFKAIVESSNEAIGICNSEGRVVYVNPAHEKLFKRPLEEAEKFDHLIYYTPETVDILRAEISPALERGETWEGMVEMIDAEGRRFTAWERADAVRDADGTVLYGFGLMHDITKQKQAEEALRESEERYRALFDNAGDAIFVHDLEGRLLDVNLGMCERLGYDREQLLRMFAEGKVMPHCPVPVSALTEKVSGEERVFLEIEHVRRDGAMIPFELNSRVISFGDRRVILSIGRDITRRRQVEKKLQDHLHFLQTLINTIPNPIFFVDTGLRYQGCNNAFEKYLGRDSKGIIGKSLFDLYPAGFAQRLRESDLETLQNAGLTVREYSTVYADGDRRDIILSKAPLVGSDRKVQGLVGVMVDITKIKDAKRRLREAKLSAELAYRAKSDFLAVMSHELRTPLNAVIGFTQLLLDRVFGELTTLQEEHIIDIHQSAQRLHSQITDILEFAMAGSDDRDMLISDIKLDELIEKSITLIRPKASERGMELSVEMSAAPVTIRGDERKLRQVLYNLLSNAVKFNCNGGEIRVLVERTGCVKLSEHVVIYSGDRESESEDAGGLVHLCITDTGIGIRPEDLNLIFEPFRQADTSLSRKYQGFGLGLALSRIFTEMHGGQIWAESEGAGKGSSFHLVLPVSARGVQDINPYAKAPIHEEQEYTAPRQVELKLGNTPP